MNSRQVVLDTIEHNNPPRIPFSLPEPYMNDFTGSGITVPGEGEWEQAGDQRWERKDMWGNTWARVDPTSKGEIHKGALEDLDNAESFPLPPLDDPVYYEQCREKLKENNGEKFFSGSMPGFVFNIARKLRRLDQYLMDLLIEKEKIGILHDRIEELLQAMIRNYGECGVDGIMFCEDWGTQEGLLINPELFRKEFIPRFTRLCSIAKEYGLKVLMHSCGKITEVIPDMIQAGIDVFQFDQPQLHGIDKLSEFSDRVSLWCPIDIQKTLQTKDEHVIRAEAQEMIRKLWKKGGFFAGYYGDNVSIGLEPEIQDYACKAFTEYGNDLSWLKTDNR